MRRTTTTAIYAFYPANSSRLQHGHLPMAAQLIRFEGR